MAKIIEHNFNRKAGQAGRDLLTASFSSFVQEMEDKKALLGEMVMQARIFLAQEGRKPGEYVLSESYLREFLVTRLEEEAGERPGYAELVYLNGKKGRITALCQFASQEEGRIMFSYQIYALDGAMEGNRRWKAFNFMTKEWFEDEEDCFDLPTVLHEIGMFAEGGILPGPGPKTKD